MPLVGAVVLAMMVGGSGGALMLLLRIRAYSRRGSGWFGRPPEPSSLVLSGRLAGGRRRSRVHFVRDRVEVTDSMLSKQISLLEQAGYLKVHKAFIGKRGRTWLSLTKAGRRVFERHLAALREIAAGDGSYGEAQSKLG